MSNNTWTSLLNTNQFSQVNVGTALANSVAATDVSPGANTAGQAFTFPASYLRVGQQYRVTATGIISNTGTPNLTLGIYYGGAAGTALATTGALATLTGLSNALWKLSAELRVDAEGTSGAIRTLGTCVGPFSGTVFLPATSSSGNSVTVDTSAAKILTVGATFGTASASNSLQVITYTIERLNEG